MRQKTYFVLVLSQDVYDLCHHIAVAEHKTENMPTQLNAAWFFEKFFKYHAVKLTFFCSVHFYEF